MSLPLIVRRDAEHNLAEAALWYEGQREGLGASFLRYADACISRIARYPEIAPIKFSPFRRCLIPRFPYAVFYSVEPHAVVVHAVLHASSDPDTIRRILNSWRN